MLTIPTAAANRLNSCQRLYPSIDISRISARRGKTTVTSSHDFISDTQATLRGPKCIEPADGTCSLRRRDFGTFPPADARQNYNSFGHTKKRRQCPLLTQSRHRLLHRTCPLSGVKRTSAIAAHMSAFDPKRTSVLPDHPFQSVRTCLLSTAHVRYWPEADIQPEPLLRPNLRITNPKTK